MKTSLQTIDTLLAELQGLMPLKPEYQQRLDKKIRLEFNYNSNHIEGNTLTYGETELLLIFDKTTGNHELREYEEMKAHDVVFEMIKEWARDSERPLNEADLKNLHKLLLVRAFWKEAITADGQPTRRLIEAGDYKKFPNSVRLQNGEIFHYASPDETPIQMGELMQWYRDKEAKAELHPVALAALLHYKFVRIHPFDDGNGRVSRLLMNYVLLKNGFPPVIIKSADKKNYLFALNQADTGDHTAFIEYVASQAIWSLQLLMKAAKGESLEEDGDLQKEIALLKQQASGKNIVKHPGVVYSTFQAVEKSVWRAVLETVNEFKELYAESKEVHKVNSMPEPAQDLFRTAFSYKKDQNNIFGYDAYSENISIVQWDLKLYGISSMKGRTLLDVAMYLSFSREVYTVSIKVEGNTVWEIRRIYGAGILNSDIKECRKNLGDALLSEIKSRLNDV